MTDGIEVAVNAYGSPAMAKGGSGDILTGIMAAVIAQKLGNSRLEQMQLAAILHGMAGIRAAKQYGEYNALPEHIVDAIRLDDSAL